MQDTTGPIIDLIKTNKIEHIVITTHHKPDGDALGSSLALFHFLKPFVEQIHIVSPTDFPEFLNWLPDSSTIINFENNKSLALKYTQEAQLIFCLDFNSLSRIYEYGQAVATSNAIKVMIDHHQEPSNFDDYRLWTIKTSSTCELVFNFMKKFGDSYPISKDIATCIYTGIMTDTGSFRFESTSSQTHQVISQLIDLGVEPHPIHQNIYDNNSLDRLRMLGFILSEKIEILPQFNTALIYLTKEELEQFNVKTGDTEGFVNWGLSISGIKLSVIIIDRTKMIKMSFRSKGDFPCNTFAKDFFNGGGHKNAAGGQSDDTLDNVINKFKTDLKAYEHYLL